MACYEAAFRLIKKGKATWDLLVSLGLALDRTRAGHDKGLFMKAFESNMKGEDVPTNRREADA